MLRSIYGKRKGVLKIIVERSINAVMAGNYASNQRLHEQAAERALKIIRLRDAGASWVAIAQQFKISRQRAQQLYDKHVCCK